jgi:hypothetical protein
VVVSDRDLDTEPEEDDCMITVDKRKDLLKALKKDGEGSDCKGEFYAGNDQQKNGHDDISNHTQGL